MPRLPALLAVLCLLVAACGEPEVDLLVPPRAPTDHVFDAVGLLDDTVEERLLALSERTGVDVVAVAFEDERASLGQADRGGKKVLGEWEADVVLVAVASPGDFESEEEDRRRFFGVYAEDRFTISRALREAIVEEAVPGPAADNDWTGAFHAAIDVLSAELEGES